MSPASQSIRLSIERLRRSWRSSPMPGFFRWWGSELRALLPLRWRGWFGRSDDWYLLSCNERRCEVRQAGHAEPLARWSARADQDRQNSALGAALRHVDREDLRLALLLPPALVLRRTLLLPLAARDNLEQVVGFEMDRQTPFTLAQVYYDVRDLRTSPSPGRFNVELVAVTRSTLDPLLARLRTPGVSIDAVDVAVGAGRLGVNLLPPEQRTSHPRPRLRLNLVLAGVCVLLLGLALGQWLHNRRVALAAMQAQVSAMRSEAQQVAALRTQLQDNAGAAGFLAQRKKTTVSVLSVLRDATQRLPASAWLERFSIDDSGQIGLQGQATQAARLLDALKDSRLITHASFQGSIQPDPTTGKERFYLTAQMPEPAAKPRPADIEAAAGNGGGQ